MEKRVKEEKDSREINTLLEMLSDSCISIYVLEKVY